MKDHIYKHYSILNGMGPKLLLAFVLVFFMIATASAVESSYKYRVGQTIDIKNPCYYNGTFCSASASCTISVYDPTNAIIVNNQPMTFHPSFFNYTLPGNNWSLGQYKCDMTCSDFGSSGSQTFYIEVQTGGNQALFIILSIASLLLLLVAVLLRNNYLGFISSALFIVTGLYVLIYGVGDLLGGSLYTNAIGWIMLGLGIFFMIASAYSAIAEGGLFYSEEGQDSLDSDSWGSPNAWG